MIENLFKIGLQIFDLWSGSSITIFICLFIYVGTCGCRCFVHFCLLCLGGCVYVCLSVLLGCMYLCGCDADDVSAQMWMN